MGRGAIRVLVASILLAAHLAAVPAAEGPDVIVVPPPAREDSPLTQAYAALLNGHRDRALTLLRDAHAGPEGAAADMIRASLLLEAGDATAALEARALLAARAAMTEHAAVLAAPWACDRRKGFRSALFDLAMLDATPDANRIEQAVVDGDGRTALWLGESFAAHGGARKSIDRLLNGAFRTGIVESYYPLAVSLMQAAGDTGPVDVPANFYLFAITIAADERAIADVTSRPPKVPERVFRQMKARIETDRHEGLTDEAFGGLLETIIVKARAKLAARPPWERRFCAVREP